MPPDTRRLAAKMLARSPDAKRLVVGSTVVICPMDDRHEMIDDGNGGAIKAAEIVVLVGADTPAPARGTAVTYSGVSYTVRDTMKQENGDYLRWLLVPTAP